MIIEERMELEKFLNAEFDLRKVDEVFDQFITEYDDMVNYEYALENIIEHLQIQLEKEKHKDWKTQIEDLIFYHQQKLEITTKIISLLGV